MSWETVYGVSLSEINRIQIAYTIHSNFSKNNNRREMQMHEKGLAFIY